jgi:hypothetical protein
VTGRWVQCDRTRRSSVRSVEKQRRRARATLSERADTGSTCDLTRRVVSPVALTYGDVALTSGLGEDDV